MREMKDSGIEWFGKIPKKWTIKPIKYLYTIRSGATPKSNDNDNWDGNIVWVTPADFKTEDKYISSGARNISEKGYRTCNTTLVPEKSIIFSKRAPIGTVVLSKGKLCTNQGCLSCVNNDTYNSLYYYYLMSILTEQFNLYGYGTTFMEISANNFANFKFVVPPKYEQDIIAKYLDKECAKYELITKDIQCQIEILQEYKQSVITEAVTKGLDKNVAMKDSGIEWIGIIPENWTIKPIKYIYNVFSGATPKSNDLDNWDGDITWITPADFKTDDKYVSHGSRNITEKGYKTCNTTLLPENSIIFSKRAPIGTVALSKGILCTNQGCLACVKNETSNSLYYYYLMSVLTEQFNLYGSGTTFMEISTTNFENFKVVVPSKTEQEDIARYLDSKCNEINMILADKQKQLDTLTEYKKSLIYEYVTGKKEVPADA